MLLLLILMAISSGSPSISDSHGSTSGSDHNRERPQCRQRQTFHSCQHLMSTRRGVRLVPCNTSAHVYMVTSNIRSGSWLALFPQPMPTSPSLEASAASTLPLTFSLSLFYDYSGHRLAMTTPPTLCYSQLHGLIFIHCNSQIVAQCHPQLLSSLISVNTTSCMMYVGVKWPALNL